MYYFVFSPVFNRLTVLKSLVSCRGRRRRSVDGASTTHVGVNDDIIVTSTQRCRRRRRRSLDIVVTRGSAPSTSRRK